MEEAADDGERAHNESAMHYKHQRPNVPNPKVVEVQSVARKKYNNEQTPQLIEPKKNEKCEG